MVLNETSRLLRLAFVKPPPHSPVVGVIYSLSLTIRTDLGEVGWLSDIPRPVSPIPLRIEAMDLESKSIRIVGKTTIPVSEHWNAYSGISVTLTQPLLLEKKSKVIVRVVVEKTFSFEPHCDVMKNWPCLTRVSPFYWIMDIESVFNEPYLCQRDIMFSIPGLKSIHTPIIEDARFVADLGARLWDGAFVLCSVLVSFLKERISVSHLTCLELGAGCSLVSLVMASLWPQLGSRNTIHVHTTDMTSLLPWSERHCNRFKNISVSSLDWSEPESWLAKQKNHPIDLILCADVVYNSESHGLLLNTWLALTLKYPNALIVLAYKERVNAVECGFFEAAQDYFESQVLACAIGVSVMCFKRKDKK